MVTNVSKTAHANKGDVEDRVFKALADNTRRHIVKALANEPLPVYELANQFKISRPAVSRHLRVLREAGLIQARDAGRENIYYLKTAALRNVEEWLNTLWAQRLVSIKALAEGISDD